MENKLENRVTNVGLFRITSILSYWDDYRSTPIPHVHN